MNVSLLPGAVQTLSCAHCILPRNLWSLTVWDQSLDQISLKICTYTQRMKEQSLLDPRFRMNRKEMEDLLNLARYRGCSRENYGFSVHSLWLQNMETEDDITVWLGRARRPSNGNLSCFTVAIIFSHALRTTLCRKGRDPSMGEVLWKPCCNGGLSPLYVQEIVCKMELREILGRSCATKAFSFIATLNRKSRPSAADRTEAAFGDPAG